MPDAARAVGRPGTQDQGESQGVVMGVVGEVVIYQTEYGNARLKVRLDQETVWLSQKQMAELFGRERSVITKYLGNVFREGELDRGSNVQNLHIANSDKGVMVKLNGIVINQMELLTDDSGVKRLGERKF